MKFTIANALTIIDKYKVENTKKMGMTFNKLCNSCTNVDAIPKSEYEARLKADMVTILEDLGLQFDKISFCRKGEWKTVPEIKAEYRAVIREKINTLKGESEDEK